MTEKKVVDAVERGMEMVARMAVLAVPNYDQWEQSMRATGEAAITGMLKWSLGVEGIWSQLMRPVVVSSEDTIVFDYHLRFGAADIVLFHTNGTATVVELKDGAQGFRSVVGGIGQAGLYACQLDPSKALKGVRRALAWTPVAEPSGVNVAIEQACRDAGLIPVLLPPVQDMVKLVMRAQVKTVLEAIEHVMGDEKAGA